MKQILIKYFVVFCFIQNVLISQNADCETTTLTVCSNIFSFPFISQSGTVNSWGNVEDLPLGNNISNPLTNPTGTNTGCLLSGESSGGVAWLKFYIISSGSFELSMTQSGFQDWAMWEYDDSACGKITNNTLPPVRCNWNASSSGGTGIGNPPIGAFQSNYEPTLNVIAGQSFIICVTNFSNITDTIELFFNGTASLGCNASNALNYITYVCPTESVTLSYNSTYINTTYTWQPMATNSSSISVTPISSSVYTLYIAGTDTTNNTNVLDTVTYGVVVKSLPNITINSSNPNLCNGDTTFLSAYGGQTYIWHNIDSVSVIKVFPNTSSIYTISTIGYNDCENSKTYTLQVYDCINNPVINNTICVFDSIVLNGIVNPSNISYTWFPSGLTTNTIVAFANPNSTFTFVSLSTNTLTNNLIKETTTYFVGNHPFPSISLSTSHPLGLCVGETATLSANGADNYLWSTNDTNSSIVVSPSISTVYYIEVSDTNNCQYYAYLEQSVSTCVSVFEEELKNQVLIFPNPSNEEFTINNPKQLPLSYELYNSLGQKVWFANSASASQCIDTRYFAEGAYVLKINNKDLSSYKKIVVQH